MRIVSIIMIYFVALFFPTTSFSELNYKQARKIVVNLPGKGGKTVGMILNEKAIIPVIEDLGWIEIPLDDGGFSVERLMLLNKTMKLVYRWEVDKNGAVKPINGKAIGITK